MHGSYAMVEALGWVSSFILVATIGKQVHRQWRSGTSQGVSVWLFVGQATASFGFCLYSLLIGNWVFVVTNGLLGCLALLGLGIVRIHRRREGRMPGSVSLRTAQASPRVERLANTRSSC